MSFRPVRRLSRTAASIWAPSRGGMGSRLNRPVSTLAAQKAAPQAVNCRLACAQASSASRALAAGPAAARQKPLPCPHTAAPGLHTKTRHRHFNDGQPAEQRPKGQDMPAFVQAGCQQADPQELAAVEIEQQIQQAAGRQRVPKDQTAHLHPPGNSGPRLIRPGPTEPTGHSGQPGTAAQSAGGDRWPARLSRRAQRLPRLHQLAGAL